MWQNHQRGETDSTAIKRFLIPLMGKIVSSSRRFMQNYVINQTETSLEAHSDLNNLIGASHAFKLSVLPEISSHLAPLLAPHMINIKIKSC